MTPKLAYALGAMVVLAFAAGGFVTASAMGYGPAAGWMTTHRAAEGHMSGMDGMMGGMHGRMHGGSEAGTNGTGTLVLMRGSQFQPTTLYVRVGETVLWRNDDSVAHTVTSDAGSELDSPLLEPGESWSHTFTTTGTFEYHCTPHSWQSDGGYAGMTARVIVEP